MTKIFESLTISTVGESVKELELLYTASGNANDTVTLKTI